MVNPGPIAAMAKPPAAGPVSRATLKFSDETAMAFVELKDSAGVVMKDTAHGDGPIDAVFSAIQKITGVTVTLEEYVTRAVTGGKDAQGETSVRINHHGRKVRGRGVSTDVIEAAAEAAQLVFSG